MDTEWIPAVIYGFGLIGFGVLLAVSRHEEVTEDPGGEEEKLQALFLPFRRAARFLKKKKRYGAVPGAGAIQNDLTNLPFELRRKAGDCSRVTAGPIDLI